MKYERQQHSPLFIALQERKRKIEKAATPHTLQGRAGIIFSLAKEELHPIFFRIHVMFNGNSVGQFQSDTCPCASPPPSRLHPLAFAFLNCHPAKQMLGESAGRGFVLSLCDYSNPSVL